MDQTVPIRQSTPEDAANQHNVSTRTIMRWVARDLPCDRPSRNITRFNLDEVREWVALKTEARLAKSATDG